MHLSACTFSGPLAFESVLITLLPTASQSLMPPSFETCCALQVQQTIPFTRMLSRLQLMRMPTLYHHLCSERR